MDGSADFLGTQGNYSLIRSAGRRFPGLLIQGDTLSVLVSDLREVGELLETGDIEEARSAANELLTEFSAMQASYEVMMKEAGIKLPYAKNP
ncbi:hypothetical protein [Nocardia sp. NPDC023988]|uniref:DUF6959 family protein n=1 Tax=unclassified Nocardia TaxID=2637762 RepID=UPI0033E3E962